MLLGNKVDLRDAEEAKGETVVKTESGQKLAKVSEYLISHWDNTCSKSSY